MGAAESEVSHTPLTKFLKVKPTHIVGEQGGVRVTSKSARTRRIPSGLFSLAKASFRNSTTPVEAHVFRLRSQPCTTKFNPPNTSSSR